MPTFRFSTLANGQRLAFEPLADLLRFDDAGLNAAAVRVNPVGSDLGFTVGSKTVWLAATALGELASGPTGTSFANGSRLSVGDGTPDLVADWYGRTYALGASTVGEQVWGIGGADVVRTGTGSDWLVGNGPLTPLNHVSRDGSTGSPTSSSDASISADGRFVAFFGGWQNFGSESVSSTDVFVKDMTRGTVTNEHASASGELGRSGSGNPVISADGNWLVFWSASALVPEVSGTQIYVASTTSNAIHAASTTAGGAEANAGTDNPDISATGRYVVFESGASNLAPGSPDDNGYDIFTKDMVTGEVLRVSTSLTGGDANADCSDPRISADGRYVVFTSAATNLSANVTGTFKKDVYLWDRSDGSLTNLTAGVGGVDESLYPDVAADGRYGGKVVFQTGKALDPNDTNNTTDVYAYDIASGAFTRVSVRADGGQHALASFFPSVSDDGRWVVFRSGDASTPLVPGDSNGYDDIFVKDLVTGAIALVSKPTGGGQANQTSSVPAISAGGDWIVFESSASNLAGATDGNGGFVDVFRISNPLLRDDMRGGAGDDTYVVQRLENIVEGAGGGTDTVRSTITWTLGPNLENLVLAGTASINGTGNGLANVITGNAGNNVMSGGAGNDTVSYEAATAGVTVSLALTTTQATGGAGNDRLLGFENLIGSAFNDTLTGSNGNNWLDGGTGADRVDGGAGKDTLLGGTANDVLIGGPGNDTYVMAGPTGSIIEEIDGGIDTVRSSVTWTLQSTLEHLTLTGSAAISGNGNNAANAITGNEAANTLRGYGGNDTLIGGAGNDSLQAGDGNDRLDGGAGNDTLIGGAGDDVYIVDSPSDVIGGDTGGIDSVISRVSWTLQPALENLTLTGTSPVNGGGNGTANRLAGNAGANRLSGEAGDDTIAGGGGNDTLIGGDGADQLSGGAGADVFTANSRLGSDTVTDFVSGTDRFSVSMSRVSIGDGDLLVEGAAVRDAPGGFSASSELVIFTTDAAGLSTTAAASAIGSANSAYALGRTALFVIDNGAASAIYLFQAGDADPDVEASELTLLARLQAAPATVTADYFFTA